jgi:hypothetical protein
MEEAPKWLEHDANEFGGGGGIKGCSTSRRDIFGVRGGTLRVRRSQCHHLHRDRELGEELEDNPLQIPPYHQELHFPPQV